MTGVARCLANRASLLGLTQGKRKEALILAEEAYRIAMGHNLKELISQIKQIMDAVKANSGAQAINNQANVEEKKVLTFSEKGNPICLICKLEGNKGAKICKYCKKPYTF